MSVFKIESSNNTYESASEMTIAVPDELIREFTTIVNAGVAKVLAKAGILLIQAENGTLNPAALMSEGLKMSVV